MTAFLSRPDQLVNQLIDFNLQSAELVELESHGGGRILMHRQWSPQRNEVALISGGGAGHEPAHAGFVGEGMLSGVVVGELFASPSVSAIEDAIAAMCTARGCLLIVKNYTGDRLNFGLAAERSRARGLQVAMVLVADDAAMPDARQPRGLAGTLLVHRIAGYHAAQGDTLTVLHDKVSRVAASLKTIGLALGPAQMPGKPPAARKPALGLGIHNEAGVREISVSSAADAVQQALEALGPVPKRVHLLVNNLGGCSPQEMMLIAKASVDALGPARIVSLIGPATLMSALGMQGFSLTLLEAGPLVDSALQAATSAPAWPTVRPLKASPERRPLVRADTAIDTAPLERSATTEALLRRVAMKLLDAQSALDELDQFSGDGDAGSTFAGGARALLKALDEQRLPTASWPSLAATTARLVEHSMGGSSGILLSIMLTTAATAGAQGAPLARALLQGVANMQHYGGAQPGDRTMLDALIPALEAWQTKGDLASAASAARAGAEHTALLNARAGRAALVPDSAQRGHNDPGAEAMARIFEALAAE